MKPPTTETPSQRLAKCLEDQFPEERIAAALSELAAATSTTRSGTIEPDSRVRLAALQLVIEHRFGRATPRSETPTIARDVDEESDVAERAKRSPALRAMLRRLLSEAGEPLDA
ncbi:MAG: hypothetical protein WCP35_13525 [Verrucomicrobiota bacterium]